LADAAQRRAGHTKAPEGTGGDLRSTGPAAANKSAVTGRRRVPRSPALRPANLVPGTVPRITPPTGLAVQPAPSGKTKCTARGHGATTGLSPNLHDFPRNLSPHLRPMWTVCGYTRPGGCAVARLLARLVASQDGWARPFGDFNHRWLSALFRPIHPIKDFLDGTWLGHPVHGAVTDLPIGALLLALLLGVVGQNSAADIAIAATILFMLGAAVTGASDYADTDGTARTRATLHATLMVVGLVVLLVSLGLRAGGDANRSIAIVLAIVGFLLVSAGAFVGGDVVYVLGNMVNRHAFRGAGTKC